MKTTSYQTSLLNVGCGSVTHWEWNNLDFSPYAAFRRHPRLAAALRRAGFLSQERHRRLLEIDPQILHWDLRRGIPFADAAFDAVYHAHVLEHLDRPGAGSFLAECHRVLKPSGIARVVVPDLEAIATQYKEAMQGLDAGRSQAWSAYDDSLYRLFDQMVRSRTSGTSEQTDPIVRLVERVIRGGAARTGERHRWMYDRHSLARLLQRVGFSDVRAVDPLSSRIKGWEVFSLDLDPAGAVRHPMSLYMEAVKE